MAFMRIEERQPERAGRGIDREAGLFKGRLWREWNRAKRLAGNGCTMNTVRIFSAFRVATTRMASVLLTTIS